MDADALTSCPDEDARTLERRQVRRLEAVFMLEATTLLILVCVAVPLKHLAHWPLGVRILGPVHGFAFTAYVWVAIETVAGGSWSGRDAARLFVVALIPFGGYANLPFLARRVAALRDPR